MATATSGTGFNAYKAKLSSSLGALGFDWQAILKMIMEALSSCFAFKPPTKMVRRRAERLRPVAATIQEAYPDRTGEECFAAAKAHADAVNSASDDELQAVIDDCFA